MGQVVCGQEDDFVGQGATQTISRYEEVFVQGQLPIVNQNPHTFNDDDFVKIYSTNVGVDNSQQGANGSEQLLAQPYDLRQNVSVNLSSSLLENHTHQAILMEIVTQDIQLIDANGQQKPRNGVDLICLIDHSGSMQGEKINLVKRTLKDMLDVLNERDRLCIIMFDCKCYRLTRLMKCSPNNKNKFIIAIDALQARGGTDIGNGMKMALSVLKHRRYKNPVSAIFLLSDGVDEGAEERVKEDLRQYHIRDPFVIKTFGFGKDCCPKMMSEIAHLKEGQFYFLSDINKIDECFMEAFGGLVSVIANNVKLTVKHHTHHIQLRKAYGDKWQIDNFTNTYHLYQPHLLCGVKKGYLIEVIVNGDTPQEVDVILELHSIEGEVIEIKKTIEIKRQDNHINKEVIANYCRVQGAETFEKARVVGEQGHYQQSQQIIQATELKIEVLKMAHDIDNPQIIMVATDLKRTKSFCNESQFSNQGRHEMHSKSTSHMYQKSTGDDDCAYQNNCQRQFQSQQRLKRTNSLPPQQITYVQQQQVTQQQYTQQQYTQQPVTYTQQQYRQQQYTQQQYTQQPVTQQQYTQQQYTQQQYTQQQYTQQPNFDEPQQQIYYQYGNQNAYK